MREDVFRGKIISVAVLDGKWEVVAHPDAVAVLVQRGPSVLGVRQSRPATGLDTWELPAGLIDPGESPEEAARRELAEETQLGGRLSLIAPVYASPGFSDECIWLYEAHDVRAVQGTPDEGEELRIEWRNASELWAAVALGEVATSAVSMLGVRHALARLGVTP